MSEFLTNDSKDSDERSDRREKSSEGPAPVGQEGTIFARPRVELFSRPLLDVINETKPPAAVRAEASAPVASDVLPSVSPPSQSEVRTYIPPILAEAARQNAEQMLRTGNEEDDDNEGEETEGGEAQVAETPEAVVEANQEVGHEATVPTLKDQFEQIMRDAVGEDYDQQLATNDHLQQPEQYSPEGAVAETRAIPPLPPHPFEAAMLPPTPFEPTPVSGPTFEAPTAPPSPVEESEPRETTVYDSGGDASYIQFEGGGSTSDDSLYNRSSAPVSSEHIAPAAPTPEKEKNNNGLWFVAGAITGWVVKQHLANKRIERIQQANERQVAQQNERMQTMAAEQRNTQYQLQHNEGQLQQQRFQEAAREAQSHQAVQRAEAATQQARDQLQQQRFGQPQAAERFSATPRTFETPLTAATPLAERPFAANTATAPRPVEAPRIVPEQPQTVEQAQLAAQELVAKAYELQDGQHVEIAAGGGHAAVMDKYGHLVNNAIEYGDEFKAQQRQEQAKGNVFDTSGSSSRRAGAGGGGGAGAAGAGVAQGPVQANPYAAAGNGIVTGLGSGQIGPDHDLPAGTPTSAERQRLLPSKKENPVVATIASPWLWAAIIVLLLAFFTAAFI